MLEIPPVSFGILRELKNGETLKIVLLLKNGLSNGSH